MWVTKKRHNTTIWGSVMARYCLANHVFVCRDENYVVVLDVHEDRYFTLDAGRTAALAPVLPGWPASRTDPGADTGPPVEEVIQPLLSQGWLLEGEAGGKNATPVNVVAPYTEVQDDSGGRRPRIDLRAVLGFCTASVRARFLMRMCSFERVV